MTEVLLFIIALELAVIAEAVWRLMDKIAPRSETTRSTRSAGPPGGDIPDELPFSVPRRRR